MAESRSWRWRIPRIGRHAMRGSVEWWSRRWGWVTLWLPFVSRDGIGISFSPNGTPWAATLLIGRRYPRPEKRLAAVRRALWGHAYDCAKHDPQRARSYARAIEGDVPIGSDRGAVLLLIATHPTTTKLPDGRVQITLSAEECRAIREASR